MESEMWGEFETILYPKGIKTYEGIIFPKGVFTNGEGRCKSILKILNSLSLIFKNFFAFQKQFVAECTQVHIVQVDEK